jgi:hypothetical protein
MPNPVVLYDQAQVFLHLSPGPDQRMFVFAKITDCTADQLGGFDGGCFGPGCAGKYEFALFGDKATPKCDFFRRVRINHEPI